MSNYYRPLLLLLALVSTASTQRPAVRRSGSDTASVQFMITNAMAGKLRELGYTSAEISSLAPDRAAAIIDNGIHRPSQGIPKNWVRGGNSASPMRGVVGALRRAVGLSLSAAVALHFSGVELGGFSKGLDALMRSFAVENTAPRRRRL
jgi:hypothetical protein